MKQRRRRVWVWLLLRVSAAAALIAIAGAVYAVWVGASAEPGSAVDYNQKVVDLVESIQPDRHAPDAWPLFEGVVQAFQSIEEEVGGRVTFEHIAGESRNGAPDPAIVEREERALGLMRERGVFDRLGEAAAFRRAVRPCGEGALIDALLTDLTTWRPIGRANSARVVRAGVVGGGDEIVDSIDQTLGVARMLGHQATLLERLVAMALEQRATADMRELLLAGGLDATTCRRLLGVIERQSVRPPMSSVVQTERLVFLDAVQMTHTDDGAGDGIRVGSAYDALVAELSEKPGASRPRLIANAGWFAHPRRSELEAFGNIIYDALSRYVDNDRRGGRLEALAQDEIVVFSRPVPEGYGLVRLLKPEWERAMDTFDETRLTTNGTELLLATEAFRGEQGRLPATLDELVPGVLAALPEDPFADSGLFRYKILSAPDDAGRSYLLYSVGSDQEDNDGVPHRENARRALWSPVDLSDFVINAPRPRGTRGSREE